MSLLDAAGRWVFETVFRVQIPEGADWSLKYHWPLEPWKGFLVVLAVVGYIWYVYYRENVRAPRGGKVGLGFLRVLIILLALWLLLEPYVFTEKIEYKDSVVAVLVDDSQSMEERDGYAGEEGKKRQERVKRALGKNFRLKTQEGEKPLAQLSEADFALLSRLDIVNAALVNEEFDFVGQLTQKQPDGRPKHRVKLYTFSDDLQPVPAGKLEEVLGKIPVRKKGYETRLGLAIRSVLRQLAGEALAAIVIISDGRETDPGEPHKAWALRAKKQGVPIVTVVVGDPKEPKDLSLEPPLDAPNRIRKGDDAVMTVVLRRSGLPELPEVTLQLKDESGAPLELKDEYGRAVKERRLRFPPGANRVTEAITFSPPQKLGDHAWTVELQPVEGERDPKNNALPYKFKVDDKKLKVLLCEGEDLPRWEARYLKAALTRDTEQVDAYLLLAQSEQDWLLWGKSEGLEDIEGFPENEKELFEFDVLIFGDVSEAMFTKEQLQLLERFVKENGGALVVIAGERYMPSNYVKTPLANMLPVIFKAQTRAEDLLTEPFQLVLTSRGRQAGWTRLAENQAENREIWENLPGLYWYFPVERAKRLAEVIATHPLEKDKSAQDLMPLIVEGRYGAGKVLWIGVDSLWRWRYLHGDKYFYRFYLQSFRALTTGRRGGQKRFRLSTDKQKYTQGEPVEIFAIVRDEQWQPLKEEKLIVHAQVGESEEFRFAIDQAPSADGQYRGTEIAKQQGEHRIWLIDSAKPDVRQAEHTFHVGRPDREQQDRRADPEGLLEVAERSKTRPDPGGKGFFHIDELGQVPEHLQRRPAKDRQTVNYSEYPLWERLPLFLLFLLCIIVEWLLRKKWRML